MRRISKRLLQNPHNLLMIVAGIPVTGGPITTIGPEILNSNRSVGV